MAQDTLTRTVFGRLFRGIHSDIADTGPWELIGAIFDKTYMPALLLDEGKQIYYDFSLPISGSALLPLPQNYDPLAKLYIAVRVNNPARIEYTSPTHGSSQIVLLKGTDSNTQGIHGGFWTYQGDMTTFEVSIPSTGSSTSIQVFMYEIPDLADFESYYDKQIGIGYSGA